MLIVPIIYFVSFLNCELISHLLPYPTVSHCLSMYLAMLFQFLLLFSVIVFFHPFYSVICHYLIQSFLLYLFFFNFPYFWLIFNYRTLPPPIPFTHFSFTSLDQVSAGKVCNDVKKRFEMSCLHFSSPASTHVRKVYTNFFRFWSFEFTLMFAHVVRTILVSIFNILKLYVNHF